MVSNENVGRRSRYLAPLEQQAARIGIDAAYRAARSESWETVLATEAHSFLGADAGVGVTSCASMADGRERLTHAIFAGAPPLPLTWIAAAERFTVTHPSFAAMARVNTSSAVRLSDHTKLRSFWTTETFFWMHGHSDGRYPISALLLRDQTRMIFIGLHRQRRDFDDSEVAALGVLQRPLAAALSFRAALDDTVRLLQDVAPADPPSAGLRSAVAMCRDYRPTRREAEVLGLAVQGWTNRQIGRRLGITERTVRKHLGAVYDKAGVRGRAAAAAWWQRRSTAGLG